MYVVEDTCGGEADEENDEECERKVVNSVGR